VGILYWQLFADLMAGPLAMVEGAKNLVGKVEFPREALVAAAFAKSLFTFAIRLLVLAGFTIGLGYAPSFTVVPLMLLAVVPVAALGLFCGVLVVVPGLLFKDFGQGLVLATTALLFLTPVGYDAGPLATAPAYVRWNPLSYLIEMPRAFFADTPVEHLGIVSLILGASLVALALEWVVFRVSFPIVVERMGA
jgi:lipopolysaccharide transport system permease protein